VIGPAATAAELDELRGKIHADPRAWIAQPVISLSTVPTLVDQGIRPRHVDLRPFAVNSGDDVYVLPCGLTRVALPEGELIVNSSRGGGSKDTWVLADPFVDPHPRDEVEDDAETDRARKDKPRSVKARPATGQVQSQAHGHDSPVPADDADDEGVA